MHKKKENVRRLSAVRQAQGQDQLQAAVRRDLEQLQVRGWAGLAAVVGRLRLFDSTRFFPSLLTV